MNQNHNEGFSSFKAFFHEHLGNMACGCDHGCNQWIKRQESRMALCIQLLCTRSKNLDKAAGMPLDRVNRIFRWLYMQDVRRMNEQMHQEEFKAAELALIASGHTMEELRALAAKNGKGPGTELTATELDLTGSQVIILVSSIPESAGS